MFGSGPALTRELTRILTTLALVIGVTAGLLRGLDSLPGFLTGEPRGVKRYGSVEEVERKVGARLLVPAYFPDTLQWPPTTIRFTDGPPRSVALTFADREGRETQLIVYQSFTTERVGPSDLLPPGLVLNSARVQIGVAEGELSRIREENGMTWNEISWQEEGRALVLRSIGPVDELLRIARGMRAG